VVAAYMSAITVPRVILGGHRSNTEARIIRVLEELTGKPFPQAHPAWLRDDGARLELDGYNRELGVALEFSGPLHTIWMQNKESYARYFTRIRRDALKRVLCAKNGVHLIVVDVSFPPEYWRVYLEARLSDIGLLPRPRDYLQEQVVEPFRNKQLERELRLKWISSRYKN